jgi:hypothetical protein
MIRHRVVVFGLVVLLAAPGGSALRGTGSPVALAAAQQALVWNTFLGGVFEDQSAVVAIDGSGNIYVEGSSGATWSVPVRPYAGNGDAFVAKIEASGLPVWHTFLGAVGYDAGNGLAVDAGGFVCLAGSSDVSWGSPLRPFSPGNTDAFVAKAAVDGAITPAIAITSPNGGEKWDVGSSHLITWTTEGTVGNVKIEYSADNGTSYTEIVASTPNSGGYL